MLCRSSDGNKLSRSEQWQTGPSECDMSSDDAEQPKCDQQLAPETSSSGAAHEANLAHDRSAEQPPSAPLERFLDLFDIDEAAWNALSEEIAGENVVYDVDPHIWGRHFWATLHLIAYAYPEQPNPMTKQAALQLFDALRVLLPCANCRDNYRANWRTLHIHEHLSSRASLIEWMIMLDNSVRDETNQPPLDYAAYINRLTESEAVVEENSENDAEPGSSDENDDSDDAEGDSDENRDDASANDDGDSGNDDASGKTSDDEKTDDRNQSNMPDRRQSRGNDASSQSTFRSLSIPPNLYNNPRALKRFVTRRSADHQHEMRRNPLAFASAALLYSDDSQMPLDPRRLRGAQRDSFAQASRYRQADIAARRDALRAAERQRDEQRWQEPAQSRFKRRASPPASIHGKRKATSTVATAAVDKSKANTANLSSLLSRAGAVVGNHRAQAASVAVNHRFRHEQQQRRSAAGATSALKRRGLQVKAPRPCPNCNRKALVPSIF